MYMCVCAECNHLKAGEQVSFLQQIFMASQQMDVTFSRQAESRNILWRMGGGTSYLPQDILPMSKGLKVTASSKWYFHFSYKEI